jgi:hypothetical protein
MPNNPIKGILYKKAKPTSGYFAAPIASNSEVNGVNIFNLNNSVNNSGVKTNQNFSSYGRVIDHYNDGTPSDTSYMYTTPTDNVFFSTKIDPETNKKISNKNLTAEQLKFYKDKINQQIKYNGR